MRNCGSSSAQYLDPCVADPEVSLPPSSVRNPDLPCATYLAVALALDQPHRTRARHRSLHSHCRAADVRRARAGAAHQARHRSHLEDQLRAVLYRGGWRIPRRGRTDPRRGRDDARHARGAESSACVPITRSRRRSSTRISEGSRPTRTRAWSTSPIPARRYVWRLDREKMTGTTELPDSRMKSITIDLKPMLGRVATAPRGQEAFNGIWPGQFGGNMDAPEVREGTDGVSADLPRWRVPLLRRRARAAGRGRGRGHGARDVNGRDPAHRRRARKNDRLAASRG